MNNGSVEMIALELESGSTGVLGLRGNALNIDSSGNVGIGLTDPDQALEIGAGGKLKLSRADNARSMLLFTDNNNATIQSDQDPILIQSAHRMMFNTNGGNERMRIDSSGLVSIGNDDAGSMHSNANKLVVGTGSGDQGMSVFAGTSTGRYAFARAVGNNTDAYDGGMTYDGNRNLTFHTNAGSERMRILADGDVSISNDGQIPHASSKLHIKGSFYYERCKR